MRTTLVIDEGLLKEAQVLSGAKTKKEVVEISLHEFINKRRAKKLLDLEGKIDLLFSLDDLIEMRRKDVPDR